LAAGSRKPGLTPYRFAASPDTTGSTCNRWITPRP
jgi:hypothetical protein